MKHPIEYDNWLAPISSGQCGIGHVHWKWTLNFRSNIFLWIFAIKDCRKEYYPMTFSLRQVDARERERQSDEVKQLKIEYCIVQRNYDSAAVNKNASPALPTSWCRQLISLVCHLPTFIVQIASVNSAAKRRQSHQGTVTSDRQTSILTATSYLAPYCTALVWGGGRKS